ALQGHRPAVRGRAGRDKGGPHYHRPARQRDELQHPAPRGKWPFPLLRQARAGVGRCAEEVAHARGHRPALDRQGAARPLRVPDDPGVKGDRAMPWTKPDFQEITLNMEVTAYVNTDAAMTAPPERAQASVVPAQE